MKGGRQLLHPQVTSHPAGSSASPIFPVPLSTQPDSLSLRLFKMYHLDPAGGPARLMHLVDSKGSQIFIFMPLATFGSAL